MLQAERLSILRKHIDKSGYVDVVSLTSELGVSRSTVRRDLMKLEEEKAIELTWGGAVSKTNYGTLDEYPYQIKKIKNRAEKQRMAEYAATLIKDRQSVFLDAGTTVGELVPVIKRIKPDWVIATNDIMIAMNLSEVDNILVNVVGGTLRKGYYTLSGVFAETILEEISLDVAIMSCDSVSLTYGYSITNTEEVQVKRKIKSAAKKIIMLCDHTKFSKNSFMQLFDFSDPIELITGTELDDNTYEEYREHNLNITRV